MPPVVPAPNPLHHACFAAQLAELQGSLDKAVTAVAGMSELTEEIKFDLVGAALPAGYLAAVYN